MHRAKCFPPETLLVPARKALSLGFLEQGPPLGLSVLHLASDRHCGAGVCCARAGSTRRLVTFSAAGKFVNGYRARRRAATAQRSKPLSRHPLQNEHQRQHSHPPLASGARSEPTQELTPSIPPDLSGSSQAPQKPATAGAGCSAKRPRAVLWGLLPPDRVPPRALPRWGH